MAGDGTGVDTSSRGTSLRGKQPRGTETTTDDDNKQPKTSQEQIKDSEIQKVKEFMVLLEKRPSDRRSAPQILPIPSRLYADMMSQMDKTLEDGNEHGGVFGYTLLPPNFHYEISFVDGHADKLSFLAAKSRLPRMKIVGVFHTHMYAILLGEQGRTGWQGGGFSGRDIVNFFERSEPVSALVSYTSKGDRKIYLLLKTQKIVTPKMLKGIAETYESKVFKLVKQGKDLDSASEQELEHLASMWDFVLYTSINSPNLRKI